MKHIFINLVDNAIKFCNKGSVEFGYNIKNNKEIECFVKDTGIGLSKENQSKIFRRFFQAEDINTRNYNGAGIGLSLVKGYIDALKGKIWVESETGKGSTFFFLIP
jgi:signal transduction histidine kinase